MSAAILQRFGLTIGCDDDNEELHQFIHACWPVTDAGFEEKSLALCGSKRLWGFDICASNDSAFAKIDCKVCLERLAVLAKGAGL